MPAADGLDEWELPKLRASFGFEDDYVHIPAEARIPNHGGDTEFFDVKFYPYSPVGSNPVFAAVSKKHVVVCRLTSTNDKDTNPCEIIQVIRDDDDEALDCSCTWSKSKSTETPLICISGRDAKVKVYDVINGNLHTTLVGHGGEINDLATSPANPQIVASASEDTTIRIWSLDPRHARQPCLCILGGEGHSWNLLSVSFHHTGRYVLSAGHDQTVNLWTLPDLPEDHVDKPLVNYYPHFSTSEVHSSLVDCVAFCGDLILSRACHEDVIVLWRVEGFSSEDPPPAATEAPTNHDPDAFTRSSFAPQTNTTTCAARYTRLLQFCTKGCGPQFFMRFSLLQRKGMHPVLAFCSTNSKILFWDMERLTGYHEYMKKHDRDQSTPRPPWLEPMRRKKAVGPGGESTANRQKRDSPASVSGAVRSSSLASRESPAVAPVPANPTWPKRYGIKEPQSKVEPHRVEQFGTTLVGRQVAWSMDGAWCVVVGSRNLAIILQRWNRDESRSAPASERNTPAA